MDNLSTHTVGALYETFSAPEARRILQRLEFTTHPNMQAGSTWWKSKSVCCAVNVWIAASGKRDVLQAWQQQRNASGAWIKWRFTTQKAPDKLARAYPDTTKES